jgi:hypothetical protein
MLEYVRQFISQHIELTEEEFQTLHQNFNLSALTKKQSWWK